MANDEFLERDFINLLIEVLTLNPDFTEIVREPRLGPRSRPDLIARRQRDRRPIVIEIRMRTPLTSQRLNMVASQLQSYGADATKFFGRRPLLILALPDQVLTEERRLQVTGYDLQIWDRDTITTLVAQVADTDLSTAARNVKNFFVGSPGDAPRAPERSADLKSALRSLPCGRSHWSAYQRLCADILTFLFHPPLERPLYENPNATGVNRRDIVLPNYATAGFWRSLSQSYKADFIVVDAKNNCGGVTKPHVLQLANYLSEAGTGLFGVILTRHDEDRAAFATRREQWVLYRKMILVIGDVDILQMIESKTANASPEELLRQKLQDFRLGI